MKLQFKFDDGGRAKAGYKGSTGDCVARAIAIATGRPYSEVYDSLASGVGTERKTKHRGASGRRTARSGVHVKRKWFKEYMQSLGWKFTPTMSIGSGCKVHLAPGELPMGRLIVSVSKHYTTVINGVIHDTHDPQRETGRCVYGFWSAGGGGWEMNRRTKTRAQGYNVPSSATGTP